MRLRWAAMASLLAARAMIGCGSSETPAGSGDVIDAGSGDASMPQDSSTDADASGDSTLPDGEPDANTAKLDGATVTDAKADDGSIVTDAKADADAGGHADAGAADAMGDAPADGADSSIDADTDASNVSVCDPVANTAPTITLVVSDAAAPPVQTGGQAVSGTYFLTAMVSYGGVPTCDGLVVRGTSIAVADTPTSGTSRAILSSILGTLTTAAFYTTAYTDAGPMLTLAPACPPDSGPPLPLPYSASPTQVSLLVPGNALGIPTCGTLLEVYTRQ